MRSANVVDIASQRSNSQSALQPNQFNHITISIAYEKQSDIENIMQSVKMYGSASSGNARTLCRVAISPTNEQLRLRLINAIICSKDPDLTCDDKVDILRDIGEWACPSVELLQKMLSRFEDKKRVVIHD